MTKADLIKLAAALEAVSAKPDKDGYYNLSQLVKAQNENVRKWN